MPLAPAGERRRAVEGWERDQLVTNLVSGLTACGEDVQQRPLWDFSEADAGYGRRVAEGLGASVPTSPPPGTPASGLGTHAASAHAEAGNAVG